MKENLDALEVIARTRGRVNMDDQPSGYKLFPMWGWLSAFFYLLGFVLVKFFGLEWGVWTWIGIPVVGAPMMAIILKKDHERTHIRTRRSKLVLDYWIFAACIIGIGGFLFGFLGLYEMVENPLICILVGLGAFITGEELRFKPMIICGALGVGIALGSFLLQGELWVWQMLCVVITSLVSLVLPGYMFEKDGIQRT